MNDQPQQTPAEEVEVELSYSNPQTTLRLQHGFAAAVEYVMREQQEPGQELRAVDILAALRGSLLSLAKHEIVDKSTQPGMLASAHVNKAAFLSVLDGIAEEIESWLLPVLPGVHEQIPDVVLQMKKDIEDAVASRAQENTDGKE